MKKTLTILLLIAFHGMVVAQKSVSAKLIATKTSKGVPFAHILNQQTNSGTTSNEEGMFTITGESNDSIKVSCVGFDTKTFLFNDIEASKELKLLKSENNLDGVEVIANESEIISIDKIPMKNLDAPVTTNVVNAKLMTQRNVSDLGDALKSATGVRPINRYGGFQTFRIRGFNNFVLLIDGVRDERHNISTSAPSTNLANIERIEVLKGPASVLFGHSALGGVINLVRKKPTAVQSGEFKTTYGSYNTYNMSGGIGGPISDKLRYRVDFGTTHTDGWRDYGIVTNNGSFILDYSPTKKDNIEISLQANDDLYDTDTGILVDEDRSVVDGMDPETRYNDPQDYLKHKRLDMQLKYTHKFNEKLKLTEHFAWSDDDINYLSTEWLYFNDAKDSITRGFPFYFNHTTNTIQNQLDFSYSFKTGSIEHKSVIGHSISILDRNTFRGGVEGVGTFATIAVQNPILNQGYIEAVDKRVQVKEEQVNGFYIQDWMNLSEKFKALIGLRYDIFTGTYYTDEIDNHRNLIESGEQLTIPSTALTYRAGLVYQPIKTLSVFGSYSNYYKPSRTITPDSKVFDPETGYQVEGGVKIEKNNKISLTLSGFYLLKNNIVERNTVNEYHQIGEADSKGVELDLELTLLKGFYLKAGYAFVDARIRVYDTDELQAVKEGNKLRYAPEHLANVWISYELPKGKLEGLGIGSGMNYVGENFTNSANTFELPAYTTFDATLFYQTKNVRIAINANNLADELYFTDAIYGNQFFPGMGRNYKISLGFKF